MGRFTPRTARAWEVRAKGKVTKSARAACLLAANAIVEDIHTAIDDMPEDERPVDRGRYRAGWRARPTQRGARIENAVPHGTFIEHGVRAANVRPGKAMIDALAAWVKRKGLGDYFTESPSGRPRRHRTTETEARQMAWAIALSMREKGIFNRGGKEGLQILRTAMRGAARRLRQAFAVAFRSGE